jgi:enoyl-CoA hydratase/carnithine racemase
MAIPFTRFNILPEFGSSYLLPRLIGVAKACELAFTGRSVSAQEAKELGLVNCVVPSSELQKTTNEIAGSIVQGAPLGMEMTKKALYQGLDNDFTSQLQHEYHALNRAFQTEDHHEGVKAFLEKRPPVFKGI